MWSMLECQHQKAGLSVGKPIQESPVPGLRYNDLPLSLGFGYSQVCNVTTLLVGIRDIRVFVLGAETLRTATRFEPRLGNSECKALRLGLLLLASICPWPIASRLARV